MVMGNNAVSPYQQVIEKTKSLSFRSQMLAMNIEKKMAHSNRNEVGVKMIKEDQCCVLAYGLAAELRTLYGPFTSF